MNTQVEFNALVGEHVLTGCDEGVVRFSKDDWEDSALVRFVMDGVTYEAMEDPDDGYRSSMRHLIVSPEPVKNIFPPCRVVGAIRTKGEYDECDLLEFHDKTTGKMVLAVGTENTDDYYPWFVGTFDPAAMAVNADVQP